MKLIPTSRAAMAGTFRVPLSRRSGRKSGCSFTPERLPVPPSMTVASFTSPRTISTPSPMMPYSPLCAGMQRKSALSCRRSMAAVPALWAQSTPKRMPLRCASSPISSIGSLTPNTLEACVQNISFVFTLMHLRNSATVASGSPSWTCAVLNCTPRFNSCLTGRVTALCSISDRMT